MPSANPVPKPELDLTVRRDDLVAAIISYRRGVRSPREAVVAFAGLALGIGTWLIGLTRPSPVVNAASFAAGWLILIAGTVRARHRYTTEISRLGLTCQRCREPIVEMFELRGRLKRADVILTTGRCPSCGVACFAPDA